MQTNAGFLGAMGIPLYTLCVAHTNDRLDTGEMLAAARSLLLLNGLGAAVGSIAAGVTMSWLGPQGLFTQAAVLLVILALIAVLRRFEGPARPSVRSPLPCAPQIAMTLDTRGDDRADGTVAAP